MPNPTERFLSHFTDDQLHERLDAIAARPISAVMKMVANDWAEYLAELTKVNLADELSRRTASKASKPTEEIQ